MAKTKKKQLKFSKNNISILKKIKSFVSEHFTTLAFGISLVVGIVIGWFSKTQAPTGIIKNKNPQRESDDKEADRIYSDIKHLSD